MHTLQSPPGLSGRDCESGSAPFSFKATLGSRVTGTVVTPRSTCSRRHHVLRSILELFARRNKAIAARNAVHGLHTSCLLRLFCSTIESPSLTIGHLANVISLLVERHFPIAIFTCANSLKHTFSRKCGKPAGNRCTRHPRLSRYLPVRGAWSTFQKCQDHSILFVQSQSLIYSLIYSLT